MNSTCTDGSEAIAPVIHADRNGAAARALAEAAQRRMEQDRSTTPPPERDGRGGLDPVRYGDWEINGLASDF